MKLSMWRFFKGNEVQTVLAPLFKFAEAIIELLVPWVVADIIDKGIPSGETAYIVWRCLLLVGLAFLGLAFSLTAQYFAARSSVAYSTRMRSALFAHIGTLSYKDLDRLGTPAILSRFNSDASQVQNGINMILRLFLRSPFIVGGVLVMAILMDASSSWIFALVILVLAVAVVWITLCCLPLYDKRQAKLDEVTELVHENITGVRVIRAFSREDVEQQSFVRKHSSFTRTQLVAGRVSALLNPLTYAIVNIGIILLLRTGATEINAGTLTQGQTIALYNYMSQILVELVKLANLVVLLTRSMASFRRIKATFALAPSQSYAVEAVVPTASMGDVTFENVSLTYHEGAHPSVEHISFTVPQGGTLGIIGGTGSGKTSLINLIPRFYDATEGTVSVGGIDVQSFPKEQLRAAIGIVEQKAVLFRGSIRDNLQWGNPTATDQEIMEAVRLAQATDVVDAKGGLDAIIEEGGRNLSGGQRQRLSIARALVKKPAVLILDDSSSALDNATDKALREAIYTLSTTVLIVSQRSSSVMGADRILVLEDGKAVGLGTHDELVSTCPIYAEIVATQAGGAL